MLSIQAIPTCEMFQLSWRNIIGPGAVYNVSGLYLIGGIEGKVYRYFDANHGATFFADNDGTPLDNGSEFVATAGFITLHGTPSETITATISTR